MSDNVQTIYSVNSKGADERTINPKKSKILIAIAGQQNSGKSTLFNALTGLRQHIANYPGVTVDKKSGYYQFNEQSVEAVDLPGTYALTSFSPEERVARDFLLLEQPDLIVNVVDSANIERSLYLTFQLMELGRPMLIVLNKMDVAESLGLKVDADKLEAHLGIPVIATVASKAHGAVDLKNKISEVATLAKVPPTIDYAEWNAAITTISQLWSVEADLADYPSRWAAIQLFEGDEGIVQTLDRKAPHLKEQIIRRAAEVTQELTESTGETAADAMLRCRVAASRAAYAIAVKHSDKKRISMTERIDRIVLNRFLAPLVLVLTIWVIYQLSIVQGYELTYITWPFLAGMRNFVASIMPAAGFLFDPLVRDIGLWIVDSANTLLNYVPIFFILFGLIAILEDTGYMARIAFIIDRILHRFGLHGQSTLPMILSGVFAGGCAVPGVMATKGIPDTRARMATILTVPFMNCMAKIPLYTLLVNIYFPTEKGIVLFYISTITVIVALLVSKLLTVSVLRNMDTAPFVMEMPHYHLPGLFSVLRRAFERTWIYIKKVGTIVLSVSTIIYVLLQFPGLSVEQNEQYQQRAETAISQFYETLQGNSYLAVVQDPENLIALINAYNDFRTYKLTAGSPEKARAVDERFERDYPDYFPFFQRGSTADSRQAFGALRTLDNARKDIRREMRGIRIESSLLGQVGRGVEHVTQFANFDWKINVALLTSFAARESSVATLGVLFDQDDDQNIPLEERMGAEQKAQGYDSLTAVALIVFFALYPPCLSTVIMIRVQTGSYKWMMFSMIFPTLLGLVVASVIYTGGTWLGLSGLQVFSLVYFSLLALLLIVGLYPSSMNRIEGYQDEFQN
ncbi:Ferrous iron transport protein B [Oligella ureolytica]|uniref:ferrous iron transport protein B n=1 Tax=Oligella ureolytica TaxID=90244 RepID=UPI000E05A01F|nr:ferrous iron transport protein B [Oligella ureolytica]SUA53136.1 Ferrous iron transport protein B [Oligella ureolytica]